MIFFSSALFKLLSDIPSILQHAFLQTNSFINLFSESYCPTPSLNKHGIILNLFFNSSGHLSYNI